MRTLSIKEVRAVSGASALPPVGTTVGGLTLVGSTKVGTDIKVEIKIEGNLERAIDAITNAINAFGCTFLNNEQACKLVEQYQQKTSAGTTSPQAQSFSLTMPGSWCIPKGVLDGVLF